MIPRIAHLLCARLVTSSGMPEPQTAVFQESKARFPRPYVSKIVGRSSSWFERREYASGQKLSYRIELYIGSSRHIINGLRSHHGGIVRNSTIPAAHVPNHFPRWEAEFRVELRPADSQ